MKITLLLLPALLFIHLSHSQVGIGTTNPDASATLDITSTNSGLLLPRVALSSTTDNTTITGTEAVSLLVYNTATAGNVTPGFYFWNGTQWERFSTGGHWKTTGNNGTNSSTNFIGTTDANALTFRTNNIQRLRIANGDQLLGSSTGGTEAQPFYSFSGDTDSGLWLEGANTIGLGTNGQEFLTINGTASELVINNDGDVLDFRVASDTQANALFVDGSSNNVGIATNTPATAFNIGGASSVVRIDALNATNHANNNGTDLSPLAANANGDIVIPSSPFLNNMIVDATSSTTFLSTPVTISNSTEALTTAVLHTETITLTQTTLVEVSFHLGVNVLQFSGTYASDGMPRLYGALLSHVGTGADVAYSAGSYTNTVGVGVVTTGYFTITDSGYILLGPGSHTFELLGFASGGSVQGYDVEFGGNGLCRFQVINHN